MSTPVAGELVPAAPEAWYERGLMEMFGWRTAAGGQRARVPAPLPAPVPVRNPLQAAMSSGGASTGPDAAATAGKVEWS